MMKSILLVGGGGHCHSVIDVIERENKYRIHGIVDTKKQVGETVMGYDVVGCDDDLPNLVVEHSAAVITVGQLSNNNIRERLFFRLKELGFTLPVIISPLAYVARTATLGEGTIIMHNALINANVNIGRNCIINTKALVEHDVVIEDFCHISTSSVVNGGVYIKKGCFFGSNATSKQAIYAEGFIKAGSVVK